MRGKTLVTATLALVLATGGDALAQASIKVIPLEALDTTRHLDNDEITFCINQNSVLAEFDRAVATALADAVLLTPKFYDILVPTRRPLTDFRILLDERLLFVKLTNDCDAMMGFRNSPALVPEFMSVTQAYFTSRSLFFSTDANVTSLASLKAGDKVGTRMGAPGDNAFHSYLQTLPKDSRPSRIPYPDNTLLIERLQDGSVSTIYAWELAPHFATDGQPETLNIKASFPAPFSTVPLEFSIAVLKQNTFVRDLLNGAIEQLISDGTIEDTLASLGIPPGIPAAGE